MSFHGSLQIPTPNIDVLAANGVLLHNYYVQPLCSPSRAAFLTGKHPIHLGLQHYVIPTAQPSGLPLDAKIMPHYFKRLGYATHGIGKWHLGFYKKEYLPINRGFDSFFGFWTGHMDYYDHTNLDEYENSTLQYAWGDTLRDNMRIVSELRGTYATHIFTDRAVDIIRKHNNSQPLFLFVSPNAVHTGNSYAILQAPFNEILKFPHISQPERRIFAAVVSELDKSIGKIFSALNKKKMLDDTIFVISTDNGGEAGGLRGGIGSNWPLRGTKGTLWEGGVRGVGIIWSKLLKHQPRIENNLIHICDWLPSLYSAAGGNVSDLGDIYGINLWETLSSGTPSPREEILHNIDPVDGASALRFRNYKVVNGSNWGGNYNEWYGPTGRGNYFLTFHYENSLRSSYSWEIIEKNGCLHNVTNNFLSKMELNCFSNSKSNVPSINCDPNVSPCLFDISNDPCELKNIANSQPKIMQSMLKRLEKFKSTAVPFINIPLDPMADPALHNFAWTNWADYSENSFD